MLDPARVYDTELAALCVPGEDVKAALSFIYSSGQELTAQPTDDRVSFDPFDGLDVPTWNRATERLIGGVSLDARQGTDASFLVGSDGRGVAMTTLVLTNARILVVNHKPSKAPTVGWERPLDSVAGISWSPRLLQFGRIELRFRDGSAVRLMAGMISPLAARRFVRAWKRSVGGEPNRAD